MQNVREQVVISDILQICLKFCIIDTQIHVHNMIVCVHINTNRNNDLLLVKVQGDIPITNVFYSYSEEHTGGCGHHVNIRTILET